MKLSKKEPLTLMESRNTKILQFILSILQHIHKKCWTFIFLQLARPIRKRHLPVSFVIFCCHQSVTLFLILLQEHFEICQYEDVTCDKCVGSVQRRLFDIHTTSQCPNRIIQCDYCEGNVEFWQKEV